MQDRRPFKQTDKQRLSEEATKLRKEARGTPPGVERERLNSASPGHRKRIASERVAEFTGPAAAEMNLRSASA